MELQVVKIIKVSFKRFSLRGFYILANDSSPNSHLELGTFTSDVFETNIGPYLVIHMLLFT